MSCMLFLYSFLPILSSHSTTTLHIANELLFLIGNTISLLLSYNNLRGRRLSSSIISISSSNLILIFLATALPTFDNII